MAGSLGYAVGAGLINLFGIDMGLVSFLVGLALGVAVAFVTFRFDLQRYMVISATALYWIASILGTLFSAPMDLARQADGKPRPPRI